MLREAVAQYLLWIKLVGLALVVAAGMRGGCVMQRRIDNATITTLKAHVKSQGDALGNAAAALRGSRDAMREINAEADRRIRVAQKEADAFAEAGKAAEAAKARAEKNAAVLAAQIERAKASSPKCGALMTAKLEAVCAAVPVR